MFVIIEAHAVTIHTVFDEEGKLSAAIEWCRRFPGITDNAKARACATPSPGGRCCRSHRVL